MILTYLITQIRLFFIAVWFLTRLPIPKWVGFQESWLEECAKFFPYVGWLLGSMGFIIFYGMQFLFPAIISFTISLGALVILTGAFHEDGFSDFCDGIGGGWNREDILRIMKDSRVGSFGVVGIVILFSLKILGAGNSLLIWDESSSPFSVSIVAKTWIFFICTHALSRFVSITFLFFSNYAKEEGYAKPMAKQMGLGELVFASLGAILPLGWLAWDTHLFLTVLIPLSLVRWYFSHLMEKWLQGFTGDCLGAIQQASETILLLWGCTLWTSI